MAWALADMRVPGLAQQPPVSPWAPLRRMFGCHLSPIRWALVMFDWTYQTILESFLPPYVWPEPSCLPLSPHGTLTSLWVNTWLSSLTHQPCLKHQVLGDPDFSFPLCFSKYALISWCRLWMIHRRQNWSQGDVCLTVCVLASGVIGTILSSTL